MGYCSGQCGCQPGTHNSPCVCSGSQKPINTLSPALITPLSAPDQANTSGEFKPLTSQKFLCNNRLSFWRFNSIHRGGPGVVRVWEVRRGEGLPRACHLPGEGPSRDAPPPAGALRGRSDHLPPSQPLGGHGGLCPWPPQSLLRVVLESLAGCGLDHGHQDKRPHPHLRTLSSGVEEMTCPGGHGVQGS